MEDPMPLWTRALFLALLGLCLNAGPEGNGKSEAPSAGYAVKVRYGAVDAVSGALRLNVPLGPRLPGRIPMGFVWAYDNQTGNTWGGDFRPIVWPLETNKRTITQTVMVGGQPWVFYKKVAVGVALPSAAQVQGWMSTRGVDDGGDEARALNSGASFQVTSIYPSSDGTRFLIYSNWGTMGSNGPSSTLVIGKRITVIDGDKAFSATAPGASTTTITSIWGDRIQVGMSGTLNGAPTQINIQDVAGGNSITLTLVETGAKIISNDSHEIQVPVKLTITNTLGYPSVTTDGSYTADQLSVVPNTYCGDLTSQPTTYLQQWQSAIRLTTLHAHGDTTFTWSDPLTTTGSQLTKIAHPTGLTEAFEYASNGGSWGGLSYSYCDGSWWGFKTRFPDILGDTVNAEAPGVVRVITTGTDIAQSVVIARKQPVLDALGRLIIVSQADHQTAILRYGNSTSSGAYRGVILTHPGTLGTSSDINSTYSYLFASSAILKAESVTGSGGPGGTPSIIWFPSSALTYQTTLYDGFDLRCWANPTGTLAGGLAISASPRRVASHTNGLPSKISLASGWDGMGPTQTDEYTLSPQAGTFSASTAWYTAVSAPSSPIQRTGKVSRHMDWGLLRILEDTEEKKLGGSSLSSLRQQVASNPMSFGTTTYTYDTLGRIKTSTAVRGAFTAVETQYYSGVNPYPDTVKKTLSGPDGNYSANPDQPSKDAGKAYTYGGAPHYFLTSEQDLTDGRTIGYTPDDYGRSTQTTDLLGFVTHTQYDDWGRGPSLVSRDAKGSIGAISTTYGYTIGGQVTDESTTVDGRALATSRTFDALGRLTSETKPDHKTQSTRYTAFGQLDYQSPWLLPGQSDFGGTQNNYDDKGRLTSTTYRGKLVSSTPSDPTCAGLYITSKSYLPPSNVGGAQTSRTTITDLLGQRTSVTDQASQIATFLYNQDGHLRSVTQGGLTRSYEYNDMGWLTSRTEPEEGTTTFSRFSMSGKPLTSVQSGLMGGVNGSSVTTNTILGDNNNPSSISVSAPGALTLSRTFQYDVDSRRSLRHVDETQPWGSFTENYTSDELGRLLTKTIADDTGQSFSLSRTLDALGNVLTLTYPTGGGRAAQVVKYDHVDPALRVTDVWLDGAKRGHMGYDIVSGTAVSNTLTYGEGLSANGASSTMRVDKELLAEVTHQAGSGVLLEDTLVTWSDAGLMTQRGGDSFTYDNLQRLTQTTVLGLNPGESLAQTNSGGSDFLRTALMSAAFGTVPQEKPATASLMTDDHGNVVMDARGSAALMPVGFTAQQFVASGEKMKDYPVEARVDLSKFKQGGPWDLQRLNGKFDSRFTDGATIAIGLYASAAGIPFKSLMTIQNNYAAVMSTWKTGTPMDQTWTHLPVRNVINTGIGYRLYENGLVTAP
jgi:hypothetical protein